MTQEPVAQAAEATPSPAEAMAGRLFEAGIAAGELATVYLGDRLGLYAALAAHGPATSTQLAATTGMQERYVREWLEQQAAAGILEVTTASADPAQRAFALPSAHAEVFTAPESLNYLAPLARAMVAITQQLPAVMRAFRDGGGVPWPAYGADAIEAQAALNRPAYANLLGSDWLPAIPDLHARLQSGGARVADVACGAAWSSIAIARAYPGVTIDGFDSDESSVELANQNIADAGLSDRVRVHRHDASAAALPARYDLVTVFEACTTWPGRGGAAPDARVARGRRLRAGDGRARGRRVHRARRRTRASTSRACCSASPPGSPTHRRWARAR